MNFRNWFSIILISLSIGLLFFISKEFLCFTDEPDDYKYIFSSIVPLIGTWVGTIIAFYFGKENFEAATKRYEQIIDKLTPEILDDVSVKQIMITKKSMVIKKYLEVENQTVKELIKFLTDVDKSRLPIVNSTGKVVYIIHLSFLTKFNTSEETGKILIKDFIEKHKNLVSKIHWVNEHDILESVRGLMVNSEDIQDVFVKNANGELVGWVTNTLILRYINSKNK